MEGCVAARREESSTGECGRLEFRLEQKNVARCKTSMVVEIGYEGFEVIGSCVLGL